MEWAELDLGLGLNCGQSNLKPTHTVVKTLMKRSEPAYAVKAVDGTAIQQASNPEALNPVSNKANSTSMDCLDLQR